jgi:hypothetical protein
MAESGVFDGYLPQILMTIPIHLRSREQYYKDAVEEVRGRLDWAWEIYKHLPDNPTREDFEKSEHGEGWWQRGTPPWWGLNDIIGFIEIRIDLMESQFLVALFLPKNKRLRASTRMRAVWPAGLEKVPFGRNVSASEVRDRIKTELIAFSDDTRLRRRYLDLEPYFLLLDNTDLIGLTLAHYDSR